MKKFVMSLVILGCLAVAVPIASAQQQCYQDNWGRVTCVRVRRHNRFRQGYYYNNGYNGYYNNTYNNGYYNRHRDRDRDRDDRHR